MKVAVCVALVLAAGLASPTVVVSAAARKRISARRAALSVDDPFAEAETGGAGTGTGTDPQTAESPENEGPSLGDPAEVRLTAEGKVPFSHFGRVALLGATASRLFNFAARLFPAAGDKDGGLGQPAEDADVAAFSGAFDGLRAAREAFFVLFRDNAALGAEVAQLFGRAPGVELGLRDGLALLGLDGVFAGLFHSQNPGDELFGLLREAVEADVADFRDAGLALLEAVETLRAPHKFLYARLKPCEEDYAALDSDRDRLAQARKMLAVFMNLQAELDDRARRLVAAVPVLFHARARVAAHLKSMAAIPSLPPDERLALLDLHRGLRDARHLALTESAARFFAALLGLFLIPSIMR